MCTIPPPPPPLPTLEPVTAEARTPAASTYIIDTDICFWAANHQELHEACTKHKLCLYKEPYKHKYRHFDSILQEGPTCGLVASSMLVNGKVPPSEILKIARTEGFTNNGEMFSCKNMVKLIEKLFEMVGIKNCEIVLQNGSLFDIEVIEKLLQGSVLLVPYDADFNHTPCLKNGHKAHWSLVCGILIDQEPEGLYTSKANNTYVLCKHGKSKYLAVWNLKDLDISNKNLHEFAPRRGEHMEMYVMPEGGVGGCNGLKNQFIIIDRLP